MASPRGSVGVGSSRPADAAVEGLLVVDKPAGWTSHDVVSRIRRIAGTRRVGHAGTLDPMATGVLVVGLGRATRLLGHISGHDKRYAATIRLGQATTTDDAEGESLGSARADGIPMEALLAAVDPLTGPIMQRPSSVSAIKVDGRRAHARMRSGEEVTLAARPVLVSVFDVLAMRPDPELGVLDVEVDVVCSSGTYVRALARDLGQALGVGGHLTALRRLRVGGFDIAEARTLEQIEQCLEPMDLAAAAQAAFPVIAVTAADAVAVRHGRPVDLTAAWAAYRAVAAAVEQDASVPEGAHGAGDWAAHVDAHALFDPRGELLALVAPNADGSTRYLAVLVGPQPSDRDAPSPGLGG